jgi:hypothetical protein
VHGTHRAASQADERSLDYPVDQRALYFYGRFDLASRS